jgi:tryptophanyl-tRNA synthetase
MKKKQVLSCIQPTGEMHLGSYFGAIQNWVALQKEHDCLYGIVDYHAMTMPYQPAILRQNTLSMAVDLLSCGIEPANLFIQSAVPEHTELYWILGCFTPFGELSRQTQFKDKSAQAKEATKGEAISSGLFSYPVLQAADILIYHADEVPVGKDQKQHLELARNTAQRFNSLFGVDYFKVPECLFTEIPNVRSLADPTKKMSKSLGPKHYIGLFDDESTVRTKLQQAVTGDGSDGQMSEGIGNMFELLKATGRLDLHGNMMLDFKAGRLKYAQLKSVLADAIIEMTKEFRRSRHSYTVNEEAVQKRIQNSSAMIRERAKKTLREVKEIVGLA